MNEMWAEMSDKQREEYKDYFIAYHNGVAKTGITGKRIKPLTVLPKNVISGFQKALLTQVMTLVVIRVPVYLRQQRTKWRRYLNRPTLKKGSYLQVPYDHYLLLPTWYSQLKMTALSFLPQRLAQSWAAKKYTKALPQVTPMTPVRMRHASMRSTGSYSSTLSSVLTSSSY